MGYLAPAARIVALAMAEAMQPPPPPDITEWCRRNVVFDESNAAPGPFRAEQFPWLAGIHAALSPEHPSREVTLVGSAQIGKTVSILCPTVAVHLEHGPNHALVVHPSTSSAKEFAQLKWMPMRRQAPALRQMFGPSLGTGQQTDNLQNQFSLDESRSLKIVSAGSPDDLAGTSRRLVVLDDVAKFEMLPEGDPEAMAVSRAASFADAKIVRTSTPQLEGTCRVSNAFARSTQQHFHVPCPHCGHMHPLAWGAMLPTIQRDRLSAAGFVCPDCGTVIEHRHKMQMMQAGRWVAHNPRGDHPGFYIWRAYSPLRDWASIAEDWARVQGWATGAETDAGPDARTEQTFWNDVLGRAYALATSAPKWEELRRRADNGPDEQAYAPGTVPHPGVILTAGVDCQDDRTEVQIRAYGAEARSWCIAYRVIPHRIDTALCREALNDLLRETWPIPGGQRIPLDLLAIDEGAFTSDVRDWAYSRPRSQVITVKGARSEVGPPMVPMQKRAKSGKATGLNRSSWMVNVSLLKGELYKRLEVTDPTARNHMGFPRGLPDDYYRQLTSEVRKISRNSAGVMVSKWEVLPGRRNEVLDTAVYADAAALRKGWRSLGPEAWDRIAAAQSEPPADPQPDLFDAAAAAPPAAPPPPPAARAAQTPPPAPTAQDPWLPVREDWL